MEVGLGGEKKIGTNEFLPVMEARIVLELIGVLYHAVHHQDDVHPATQGVLTMIMVIREGHNIVVEEQVIDVEISHLELHYGFVKIPSLLFFPVLYYVIV